RSLFWALTAAGGACLLWYKRMNLATAPGDRTLFVAACAVGCLTVAFWWDASRARAQTSSLMLAGLGAAALLALVACAPGAARLAGLAGSGFAGAAVFYQLQLAGLRALPQNRRATAFAAQFVWSGAVSATADMKALPALHVHGAAPNLVMAAAALAAAAAVVAFRGHLFDAQMVPVSADQADTSRQLRLIGLLAAASYVLLWASLGLQEAVFRPDVVVRGAHTGPIRYLEIPLWLGCAWVADRVGRQVLVIGALAGSLAAAAPLLDPGSPPLDGIGQGGIMFTLAAYSIGCVALIADAACYSRHPAPLVAASFAPVLVRQLVQVLARPAVQALSPAQLFLADFAVLILFTVVAAVLLEIVRRHFAALQSATLLVEVPHDSPPEPDLDAAANRYGLTLREREILSLSLAELTVAQMAQRLFITQATVKTHITNLLRKTGAASRAELAAQLLSRDQAGRPRPSGPLTPLAARVLERLGHRR
ncbi:MAG: helix-turn-helix transcriptional regulator, partial [Bifidobacteriaceae bacterium]|nr:helix-turn-helix transcriptional regulator [Bifidobacteriaceae bacterium]